jgi:hypothetical protein
LNKEIKLNLNRIEELTQSLTEARQQMHEVKTENEGNLF